MITKLKSALSQLLHSLENADKITTSKGNLFDYKRMRSDYYKKSVEISLNQIKENTNSLEGLRNGEQLIPLLEKIEDNLDVDYITNVLARLKEVNIPEKKSIFKKPKTIPSEIKEEIDADLEELEKCYNSHCYRSSVILCGRILETSLHRKYYEATEKDLLEKAPGTGLGKLISLLREQKVTLDPALTQQIHLVNQIRVFSVHVKKEIFKPSPEQTQAIILYTMDILSKLFS